MNRIKVAIIDDDPITIKILSKFIESQSDAHLIGTYLDPLEALKEINLLQPDLLFIDVEMPKMNGVDLVKKINFQPNFIFISAHPSYAIEGFNLEAIDFLVKPLNEERFLKSMEKARSSVLEMKLAKGDEQFMFVKDNNKHFKLNCNDILFVKSDMDYLHIYTSEKRFVILHTLKEMLQKLDRFGFIKAHKSYIVNKNKVEEVDRSNSLLKIGKYDVPFSRRLKKELFENLKLLK